MDTVKMARSTLKTLLVSGGGLVATWFAVAPNQTPATTTADPTATTAVALVREQTFDDLRVQEARLRQHLESAPSGPAVRNPFRFRNGKSVESVKQSATPSLAAAPAAVPAAPSFKLSGIAERKTPTGVVRTAVISGDGQLYLVGEGDLVAGRYRVAVVDSDAVTLREDAGGEIRLALQ